MNDRSHSNEQKITELLELILGTNCDPAVACAKCPELLPEISERLKQVRHVEQQLNELFPSSVDQSPSNRTNNKLPSINGYDIESILGSGGMGVVYKARHQKLNRVVALKMLRAGQFASPVELSRFSREFQAMPNWIARTSYRSMMLAMSTATHSSRWNTSRVVASQRS